MKEIKLTQGKVALVDDEDYEYLSQYKWIAHKSGNTYYAERFEKRKTIKMHRLVLALSDVSDICDHKDGNGLNNQRSNLRVTNRKGNNQNRGSFKNTSSEHKGIYWNKKIGKWQVNIGVGGKQKHLGVFVNEVEAALAYNSAAVLYHGEFARLNNVAV